MTKKDTSAAERIAELSARVKELNDAYYGTGETPFPDADYDALKDELAALVAEHPELEPADSPLGKVNAPEHLTGPTIRHARPMLSLAKASTEEAIRDLLRPLRGPGRSASPRSSTACRSRSSTRTASSTTSPRAGPGRSASW